MYLLNFKIFGHFGYIFRGKIAQWQDQPCQCLLWQSCKNRAVIAAGACGRADSVHAVCAGLHPGTVSGCHILHPKLVCSRQQGGKQRRAAIAQNGGVLPGQCFGVQHDALDAKGFRRLSGRLPSAGLPGVQPHGGACHGKALLL